MRKCSSYIISAIIVLCLFSSCGKNTVFCEYKPVHNKIWNKQDIRSFSFGIEDNSIAYDISLQLRNNDMYPYQNLWLLCEELQISSTYIKNDTIEFMLADSFGKWNGSGITLFQNNIPLRNKYHFPDTGKYIINIRHGMRDDNLKGIEDIGLLIEKSE